MAMFPRPAAFSRRVSAHPDAMSWVGIAVIAASGIVIAWREARLARRGRLAMESRAERQVP